MIKKLIKKLIIQIPEIKHLVQENNALKEERNQLLARRKVEYYEYLACLYKYLLNREVREAELKSNQYSLQSLSELLSKFLESENIKLNDSKKKQNGVNTSFIYISVY